MPELFRFETLARVEQLARIAGQLDDDPIEMSASEGWGPTRWGPASWFRIGLVALAVMIAVLLVWRVLS